MNDKIVLTAEALLAIGATEPERLFSADEATMKQQFRALAARWHPDRCPDTGTTEVFQHVSRLYEAALQKLRGGIWQTPGLLMIKATDGATYKIRYRKERAFELGRQFIAKEVVAYVIENDYADLFDNALAVIGRLPCADPRMAAEINRYLPEVVSQFATAEGRVVVLKKGADQVLLRDLLEHLGGQIDARHVAWIISSLLNVACYLDYAQLAHNAISADNWFVSPAQHSGALLGGWWYAVRQGEAMRAAPAMTINYAPFEVMTNRRGDSRTDLELIRAVGRELLGDISGMRLSRAKAVPPPMLDWLRRPAQRSAVDEYQTWANQVLKDSFGKRRFVELQVSLADVY